MPSLLSCKAQHNFTIGERGGGGRRGLLLSERKIKRGIRISQNAHRTRSDKYLIWANAWGSENLCSASVWPCFIITRRQWILNVSTPPARSFLFPHFLHECILIHNSARFFFYYSGAFLSNLMPTPYFIYWGGERYEGTTYKMTSWWLLLLTRLLALVWCYLFFKWLIYGHGPSGGASPSTIIPRKISKMLTAAMFFYVLFKRMHSSLRHLCVLSSNFKLWWSTVAYCSLNPSDIQDFAKTGGAWRGETMSAMERSRRRRGEKKGLKR